MNDIEIVDKGDPTIGASARAAAFNPYQAFVVLLLALLAMGIDLKV